MRFPVHRRPRRPASWPGVGYNGCGASRSLSSAPRSALQKPETCCNLPTWYWICFFEIRTDDFLSVPRCLESNLGYFGFNHRGYEFDVFAAITWGPGVSICGFLALRPWALRLANIIGVACEHPDNLGPYLSCISFSWGFQPLQLWPDRAT